MTWFIHFCKQLVCHINHTYIEYLYTATRGQPSPNIDIESINNLKPHQLYSEVCPHRSRGPKNSARAASFRARFGANDCWGASTRDAVLCITHPSYKANETLTDRFPTDDDDGECTQRTHIHGCRVGLLAAPEVSCRDELINYECEREQRVFMADACEKTLRAV